MFSVHYELLAITNDANNVCPNSSPRLRMANVKPHSAFKKTGRPKRAITDPVKISTTYDIIGHSERPFQQRKNFFPESNYTDIIVEAHNVSLFF